MSLNDAISDYVAQRNSYLADKAAAEELQNVQLPAVMMKLKSAEQAKQLAQKSLREALTIEQVDNAKGIYSAAVNDYEDAVQLQDNIKIVIDTFNKYKFSRKNKISTLKASVWRLKKRQLMEDFELDESSFTALEMILAADNARDPGFFSTQYSAPIDEKYGKFRDPERMEELRSQMATEMGIE